MNRRNSNTPILGAHSSNSKLVPVPTDDHEFFARQFQCGDLICLCFYHLELAIGYSNNIYFHTSPLGGPFPDHHSHSDARTGTSTNSGLQNSGTLPFFSSISCVAHKIVFKSRCSYLERIISAQAVRCRKIQVQSTGRAVISEGLMHVLNILICFAATCVPP